MGLRMNQSLLNPKIKNRKEKGKRPHYDRPYVRWSPLKAPPQVQVKDERSVGCYGSDVYRRVGHVGSIYPIVVSVAQAMVIWFYVSKPESRMRVWRVKTESHMWVSRIEFVSFSLPCGCRINKNLKNKCCFRLGMCLMCVGTGERSVLWCFRSRECVKNERLRDARTKKRRLLRAHTRAERHQKTRRAQQSGSTHIRLVDN